MMFYVDHCFNHNHADNLITTVPSIDLTASFCSVLEVTGW